MQPAEHLFIRRLGVTIEPWTMREILDQVSFNYGVSVDVLRGDCRHLDVAHARQEAMFLMYQTGRFSLGQIGLYLGGRDRGTIRHGILAYQRRWEAGYQPPPVDEVTERRRARDRRRKARLKAAKLRTAA